METSCFLLLVSLTLPIAIAALVLSLTARTRAERLEQELRDLRRSHDHLVETLDATTSGRASEADRPSERERPDETSPPSIEPPDALPESRVPAAAVPTETRPFPAHEPVSREPAPPASAAIIPSPRVSESRSEAHPPRRTIDWESLIGIRLFSWIAAVALALAAVFFLKYSFEQGLLSPPVRMTLGLVAGVALIGVGELRIARDYRVTANAIDAAGIAILYATLFASNAIWHLIAAPAAFVLMAATTALAAWLSIRRDSVFIALLGLVGGFATPALLSSGEDHPISLFGYLLLLNVGLAWVAYRKRWPLLALLTLAFTTIYQWAWVLEFLGTSRLPLAVGIFLLFPLATVAGFWIATRAPDVEKHRLFERTAAIAAVLPLAFAFYLAAVPGYGNQFHLLFAFLLALDLGLAAVAASGRAPEILHPLGALSTVLVFMIWFGTGYHSEAWPSVLGWISVFVLLYLLVPVVLSRLGRRFESTGDHATFAAPVLLFAFPILAAIEPATREPLVLFGFLLALLAAIATSAVAFDRGLHYSLAAILALIAEAIWSSRHLSAETLIEALVLYGVFALFFLLAPILARRKRLESAVGRSGAPLLFLSLAVLFLPAVGPKPVGAIWGLGSLLLGSILALMAEGRQGRHPGLISAGVALGWVILAAWWSTAPLIRDLISATIVVGAFALLVLSGHLWLQRSTSLATDLSGGMWLALLGYAFLARIALSRELSIPPAPLLIALTLLVVAIGIASALARAGALHIVSLIAAQSVIMLWISVNGSPPWTVIGLATSLGLTAVAIALMMGTDRAGSTAGRSHAVAAIVSAFLSQAIAALSSASGPPVFPFVLATNGALLIAILLIATARSWHAVPVLAVISTASACFAYRGFDSPNASWSASFALGAALYLMFLAYPLALGRRGKEHFEPWLAAVLAGIPFFFYFRGLILWSGLDAWIGLLPLTQAVLTALLLARLLRLEPPGERHPGRLALVAAAVLAFITVAVPLQLEKEWITIGWALEGAALIALWRRIPHRGLAVWSGLLMAVVFVRLVLNPAVFDYHPRSVFPIWNWYLYTWGVAALAFFAAAWWMPRVNEVRHRLASFYAAAGTILLFVLLNIEIADFYSTGSALTFDFSAGLAQDLTYTLGWALFGIALLVAGLTAGSRGARMAAIGLLLLSALKCFLHDLMRLGGLYRVGSLVGLALSLALVAILLQRFVLRKAVDEAMSNAVSEV